jgi:hypothetical protein
VVVVVVVAPRSGELVRSITSRRLPWTLADMVGAVGGVVIVAGGV